MRNLFMILMLALATSACGDDSDDSDDGDHDHDAASDEHSGAGNGGNAADAATSDAPCDVTISLVDFKLEPSEVTAKAGTIVLCAKNDGKSTHDLAVRDDSNKVLGRTPALKQGDSAQFSVDLEAGEFDIFCTQAGHESLGMKGTLTVE